MKKILIPLFVGGLLLTGITTTAQAIPIGHYFETYIVSKTGYTNSIKKEVSWSNAICNNDYITGANNHSAVLVNSEDHVRSSKEIVMEGTRAVLNVSKFEPTRYDTTKAQAGYFYKQRYVVPNLGVIAKGTFSVDDKHNF